MRDLSTPTIFNNNTRGQIKWYFHGRLIQMIQFHRYPTNEELPEITLATQSLCAEYELSGNLDQFTNNVEKLLFRFEDSRKLLLMYLRLKQWAGKDKFLSGLPENVLTLLTNHISTKLPHFYEQEAYGLLGPQFFLNHGFDDNKLSLARSINKSILAFRERGQCNSLGKGNITDTPIYFLPTTTGFFSTIENVLLMDFYARYVGGHLVLAPENFWWRYAVPFAEIFPENFSIAGNSSINDVKWFTRNGVADWLASIDESIKLDFFRFKCDRYSEIFQSANDFLLKENRYLHELQDETVLFLRGGDKIRQETISFPNALIDEEVSLLATGKNIINLISDDWDMAERLSARFSQIRNVTLKSSKGHTFVSNISRQDVIEILDKFCALCSASVSAGCASSNLINASNLVRIGRGLKNSNSKLFPIETYLLI